MLNPLGIRSICLDNSVLYKQAYSYNASYLISKRKLSHRVVIMSRKLNSCVYRVSSLFIMEREVPVQRHSGQPEKRKSEMVLNIQRKYCVLILVKSVKHNYMIQRLSFM